MYVKYFMINKLFNLSLLFIKFKSIKFGINYFLAKNYREEEPFSILNIFIIFTNYKSVNEIKFVIKSTVIIICLYL